MRATALVALAVAFWASLSAALLQGSTVEIFIWPLSQPKSAQLTQILYNANNATVKRYTPPKIPAEDEIVRIGFYHNGKSGEWSGVATAASNFAASKDKKVLLHVNDDGVLYHVGFKASDVPSSSKTGRGTDQLGVAVVKTEPGPMPHLNKPVVLNEQGQLPEGPPEKTFLQK